MRPTVPTWPAPEVGARPAPTAAGRVAYGMVEFRAMASPCRIVADTPELARRGRDLVDELERRWSRFRPDSEVSRLNDAGGAVGTVSPATFRLFERAEFARVATGGRFQPFVLDRIEALRSGDRASDHADPLDDLPVLLLDDACAVRLPAGARFDPGGIGKGLAADLVAEQLLADGAERLQIELGGDVRLVGPAFRGGRWDVDVLDPALRRAVVGRITVAEGAIATSSVLGRQWRRGDAELHDIIDPATGRPSESDLLAVTATSSELWWAEVVAKVALIAGSEAAPALMAELGASGLLVTRSGAVRAVGCGVAPA